MRRWFWTGVTLIVFAGSLCWILHRKAEPAVIELPVSISPSELCQIPVEIAGVQHLMGLAVSNKYPLSLDQDVLDKLKKQESGKGHSKSLTGVEREFILYTLPSIRLGGLTISDVTAAPDASIGGIDPGVGVVAWPFERMGLFLDLPHREVVGVKSGEALLDKGYDISRWVKVPYEKRRGGLVFEVMTPGGPLLASIECAANRSFLNCPEGISLSSGLELSIGGRGVGEVSVHPVAFPTELEFSLILGTDFLLDHVVYIDPQECCLYVGGSCPNTLGHRVAVEMPLSRDIVGCPVVSVRIENRTYPLVLDTGFDEDVHWQSDNAPSRGCRLLYEELTVNFAGEQRRVPTYLLPRCAIGGAKMSGIKAGVGTSFGASTGITVSSEADYSEPVGFLGRGLLERSNVYIDMVNGRLFLASTLEGLEEKVGGRDSFHQIPFKREYLGMVVEVDSGAGTHRYLLDSGTAVSFASASALEHLIREEDELGNAFWRPEKFAVGGINFGCERLYSYEINPLLGKYDGVLGADFLQQHPLFIDYENQVLYIKR